MTKNRKKIPPRTEAEIRYRNRNTCCICRDPNKGIVIHHIDGSRNNNDPSNLAVVCLEHHDEIHKRGGISRTFSPKLVRKFKQGWELKVRSQLFERYGPLKTALEKTLFRFEIRKTCYEIVTLKDDDINGINQRLDFLSTLDVLEGSTNQILQDLDYVLLLYIYEDENKASLTACRIPEFFYHLYAGPELVKRKKKDEANLKLAIGIIGEIGASAAITHNLKVMKSVSMAYEKIWHILILYNLEPLALKVLDNLDWIRERSSTADAEGHEPFISGVNEVSRLRELLKAVAEERQPKMEKVLARLGK